MDLMRIGRADLHMWEEPCISGERGSGAVFFCGCNMQCVYCQNHSISKGEKGHIITVDELAEEMLRLQEIGANNINLVTAGHFMKRVTKSIEKAKLQGLIIPIVYNTSSYEAVDDIKAFEGIVDVYLPDLKYVSSALSERYSRKADYFEVASKAIAEMIRQTKDFSFIDEGDLSRLVEKDRYDLKKSEENTKFDFCKTYTKAEYDEYSDEASLIMTRGTIVRHLILPGYKEDSKRVVDYLIDNHNDDFFLSIMNQYTPMEHVKDDYPELYKKVSDEDYEEVLDYAIDRGLSYGFFQDGDVALESFIPEFS